MMKGIEVRLTSACPTDDSQKSMVVPEGSVVVVNSLMRVEGGVEVWGCWLDQGVELDPRWRYVIVKSDQMEVQD